MTGERAPADRHWSELGDSTFGDIKAIWELSRFPWAFPLARAWARTHDERYAECFWTLFEDWMHRNLPNHGPNWMCGQEATFRLMAGTFARDVLIDAAATTPERLRRFQQFVRATGRRVAGNLDYALSQSNNHGVSECVGLITAALSLPGDPESICWLRRGTTALERQLCELVYVDGAFAQHSANYHRVLLHDLTWCIALLKSQNIAVPNWLRDAARRALAFLDDLLTPETGAVPLYGASDGANVLPLADAPYLDFRPAIQAAYVVIHGERRLPRGPWDEAAGWFGLDEAQATASTAQRDERQVAPEGGCFIWRRGSTRLFFRCPTRFRHRPSQADLLHVEIEWCGQSIARDAGTYGYNASGIFAGALKEAVVHNTVTFDGGEPMTTFSRFLYLPWPKGSVQEFADGDIEATHDGWEGIGAHHFRRISSANSNAFIVTDRMMASRPRLARLHWLLADLPCEADLIAGKLLLTTPKGKFAVTWTAPQNTRASLVRADPDSTRGWWSPHYLQAKPAWSLAIEAEITGEVLFTTQFMPTELL